MGSSVAYRQIVEIQESLALVDAYHIMVGATGEILPPVAILVEIPTQPNCMHICHVSDYGTVFTTQTLMQLLQVQYADVLISALPHLIYITCMSQWLAVSHVLLLIIGCYDSQTWISQQHFTRTVTRTVSI